MPRLFEGDLPIFNIGSNSGAACAPTLTAEIEAICDATRLTRVTDGRFKGGFITRRFGDPAAGIHAVQMELACRGYMRETPGPVDEASWPAAYDEGLRGADHRNAAPGVAGRTGLRRERVGLKPRPVRRRGASHVIEDDIVGGSGRH